MKTLTSEKSIMRACMSYMGLKGWFVYRLKEGPFTHKGISDCIAIRKGRVLFIEFKGPRGQQRPEQVLFQQQIEMEGGEYWLIRSLDELMERGI